jgi:glycosyltransferase involved in cell wall biosynthesis
MKVAILSFYDFNEIGGGTEVFIKHLQKVFPDSDLIKYSDTTFMKYWPKLYKINLEEIRMGLAIGLRFHEMHRERDYDLLISNGIAGWYLSILRPEIPAINVSHFTYKGLAEHVLLGTPGYYPSKYFISTFEKISMHGKINVTVSEKTKRELKKYYNCDAFVIPNGVSLQIFRPFDKIESREALNIDWDGPIGIFVGRAEYAKGFDIIESISKLMPSIRILCVTQSSVKDKNLIVIESVPNRMMPLCYSAADFFIFPSRYESASYSALEAMACDLPIVASRTGIFEDIREEYVGKIISSYKPKEYCNAIQEILKSGNYQPRKYVAQHFSVERFSEGYKNLARELVKRPLDS